MRNNRRNNSRKFCATHPAIGIGMQSLYRLWDLLSFDSVFEIVGELW